MKKMSFLAGLVLTAVFVLSAAFSQAQDSIQYQLVIRNSAGQLITNKQVNMKFSLIGGEQTFYQETMPATTDKFGNISVMVGAGKALKGSMKDVPWSTMEISLKVEADTEGGEKYAELGTVPIAAAPYAMYAATAGGSASSGSPKGDEALFEVCDRDGQPVFAVYDEGIVVYVDQNSADKAKRSGLVVTGRKATKDGETADYFAVDAEGTHIYVDDEDSDKAKRSGFVVTGRKATKDGVADSKPYADDRSATKADGAEVFAINGGLTTIYVDDTDDNAKAKRSGLVVTGRKATKEGENIIDIDGSRTNLATDALSIANAADASAEGAAPVAAMQITEASVEMSSDMAMEGGVRQMLDVKKQNELNVYLTDTELTDEPAEYDYYDDYGRFMIFTYNLLDNSYDWPATFHDDHCVPLSAPDALLMFNSNGEETAVLSDAYVAVSFMGMGIRVWPLRKLDDFKVSFALTDYRPTSFTGGSAEEYVRINVTLNSKAGYAGCQIRLGSNASFLAKMETPDRKFENYVSNGDYGFNAILGQTISIEATDIPVDKIFSHWLVNGRRYTDNPLNLTVSGINTNVSAVFKNESETIYVDPEFVLTSEPEDPRGSQNYPFSTIAQALDSIYNHSDRDKGFYIFAKNIHDNAAQKIEIGERFNDNAKYITIEISNYYKYINQLIVRTTVPVFVRNAELWADRYDGPDVVTVDAVGAKLTLENCEINGSTHGGAERTMHGAVVSAGELILVNTGITSFDKKSPAVVEKGATLTFKGNGSIRYNGYYVKTGCAVYLKEGSTLNVFGGRFWGNMGYVQSSYPGGHTEGIAGSSIYAEKNANFNVFVSDNLEIDGVGLAKGAYITVIGEQTPTATGYGYGTDRKSVLVYFDSIADPNDVVVKLADGIDPSRKTDIFSRFVVDNQSTAELGYLRTIGPEGKLVKSNEAYSKGSISLSFVNNENNRYSTTVNYTYYRTENNDEHLHLRYNFNGSNYEYFNYWLVDGRIYRDTTYANNTYNGATLPICAYENGYNGNEFDNIFNISATESYHWKDVYVQNYNVERTEDSYNLFKVDTAALRTLYTVVKSETEAGVNIYYNGDNEVLRTKNDFVIAIQNAGIAEFQKMNALKRLLLPSISISGLDLDFSNLSEISWDINETSETRFGVRVPYFEKDGERSYSLSEVEEQFEKLRTGFDVSISAIGGKAVVSGSNEEIRGFVTKTVRFDENVTLTAVADADAVLAGWSDGAPATENPHTFTIRGDGDIYPIFSYNIENNTKDFYVSANGTANGNGANAAFGTSGNPFNSVTMAGIAAARGCEKTANVVIHVSGEVVGAQVLGSSLIARSIKIEGSTNETDILNGGSNNAEIVGYWQYGSSSEKASTLTINTKSPVTISNLKITDGNAYKGGGIYCAPGSNVTLDNGVLVAGNFAVKDYSGDDKGCGGGVYNAGNLTLKGTAQIGTEEQPNKAWFGGGIYNEMGGSVYLGGSVNELTGGICYNYTENNSGGGIYNSANATVEMSGGKVSYNTSHGSYAYGAGIHCRGILRMNGGEISHNKCMYQSSGSDILFGGGVYVDNISEGVDNGGYFTMSGGEISDNEASDGGGVSVNGTFTMTGGAIKENRALDTKSGDDGDMHGSGVFFSNGTFSISGSAYIPKCTTENNNSTTVNNSNDIYVERAGTNIITIAGKLTPPEEANGIVATITPPSYTTETQVLKYALADGQTATSLAAECDKFAVTPSDADHTYSVGTNGKIIPGWMIKEGNHYYVDLGEGGKWATTNLDASSPEQYGGYYSWGITSSRTSFSMDSYTSSGGYYNANWPSDGKLPVEKDAAHSNWGSNWYMPTSTELYALKDNCHCEWTTDYNGKKGYIFYKTKNSGTYTLSDPHIFIPAAGYYYSSSTDIEPTLSSAGSTGSYWSASCLYGGSEYSNGNVNYLDFSSSGSIYVQSIDRTKRYLGKTIRPIWRPSK